MSIYLPIAELPIDIFALLLIGTAGGFLAGMFGIGGGFLVTPVLMFIGVPPYVAVATSANQIIAPSLTGFMSHFHRKNVDIKMGFFLLVGGLIGSYVGIVLFAWLKKLGQIDLVISILYVFFLGTIGGIMLYESGKNLLHLNYPKERKNKVNLATLLGLSRLKAYMKIRQMPFVTYFPCSELHVTALLPLIIGLIAGVMVSIMGIGGGFLMIPAMIYLLKMPHNMVVGTSLFQIIFTSSVVTIMHAVSTQSVDMVLAIILIFGGVIGARFGARAALRIPAVKMRFFLSLLILAVCLRLAGGLFMEPDNIYSLIEADSK